MADLDALDQVLQFIVKISPESVERVNSEMGQMNEKRVKESKATEEEITASMERELRRRHDLGLRELSALEADQESSTTKQLAQIERLRHANAERYADARKLADEEANEDEKRQKAQWERNEVILNKRKEELEKLKSQENESPLMKEARAAGEKFATQEGGGTLGKYMGDIKGITEGTKPWQSLISDLIKDIYGVMKEGLMEARNRDRDMAKNLAFTAGGVGANANTMSTDQFNTLQRHLEEVFGPKFKDQIGGAIQAVGRADPRFFSEESMSRGSHQIEQDLQTKLELVKNAADSLGVSWNDAANRAGVIAQRYGQHFEGAVQDMVQIHVMGQKFVNDTHLNISTEKFTNQVYEAADALKQYNVTVPEAGAMVSKFAVELNRGIISVADLTQWISGHAKKDEGTQAFFMQQFIEENKRSGFQGPMGDMAKKLEEMVKLPGGGMSAAGLAEAGVRVAQGNVSLAGQIGMEPGKMLEMYTDFIKSRAQSMADQISDKSAMGQKFVEFHMLEQAGLVTSQEMRRTVDDLKTGKGRDTAAVGGMTTEGTGALAAQRLELAQTLRENSRDIGEHLLTDLKSGFKDLGDSLREGMHTLGDSFVKDAARIRAEGNGTLANMGESFASTITGSTPGAATKGMMMGDLIRPPQVTSMNDKPSEAKLDGKVVITVQNARKETLGEGVMDVKNTSIPTAVSIYQNQQQQRSKEHSRGQGM